MNRRFGPMVIAAAFALAACGGSAKHAAPTPTAAPTITPYLKRDLSPEQMGAMTLALNDFSPKYAAFAPVVDSGLTAILERASTACNPGAESQALSKYEWVRGYSHQFAAIQNDAGGTLTVGSDVDVFSSADSAAAKLAYDRIAIDNDSRQSWGCNGAKIERYDDFVIESLGDESWGVRIRFSLEGIRGTTTAITFRRDRVLGSVSITRLNSEDSSEEAIDAARKVDEKMMPILTAPLTRRNAGGIDPS